MPQTDYSLFMPSGFEGELATGQSFADVHGIYEELVNGMSSRLPFGRPVVNVPSGRNGELQLPTAGNQAVRGISIASSIYEKAPDGASGFPVDAPMLFLRVGVIYMVAEEALALSDTLHYRFTLRSSGAGAFDAIGRLRNDTDEATPGTPATARAAAFTAGTVRLLRPCAAGEVVPVHANFPI